MEKEIKPKQYTHIDYEALLIYAMKNHMSIEQCISELKLNIARSTLLRNINKIKKLDEYNEIINLYQNGYVPNMQKKELPEDIERKIEELDERPIIKKNRIEDLYGKLNVMKEILDICNENYAETARVISSGSTPLGNVKITTQGLRKNMLHYEDVKKQYEKEKGRLSKEER